MIGFSAVFFVVVIFVYSLAINGQCCPIYRIQSVDVGASAHVSVWIQTDKSERCTEQDHETRHTRCQKVSLKGLIDLIRVL